MTELRMEKEDRLQDKRGNTALVPTSPMPLLLSRNVTEAENSKSQPGFSHCNEATFGNIRGENLI